MATPAAASCQSARRLAADTLHLFWDRLVGSQSGIAAPPAQTNWSTEVQSATARSGGAAGGRCRVWQQQMSEATWVRESFDMGKRYVYVGPIGPGAGPFTITQEYFETAKSVAEERVALAGARLANLLNHELK